MEPWNKWDGHFWYDLGERVVASALGGVLTMLTLSITDLLSSSPEAWFAVVGVPSATSLVKGLLANITNGNTGPSLLPEAALQE